MILLSPTSKTKVSQTKFRYPNLKIPIPDFRGRPFPVVVSQISETGIPKFQIPKMTSIDNLLKLSTELSQLGTELSQVAGKLAEAASLLQQEAANIAEEMSKQWGIDVSVNVGVRPGRHIVEVNKSA